MRVARRSSWEQGIRINYVAPWLVSSAEYTHNKILTPPSYIKSAIRSPEYEAELTRKGVQFAPQEDVAMCMMRLATDQTINGRWCLSLLC